MKSIEIQSPVRGNLSFMNPPGHHPDAKDFVAVGNSGKPYPPIKLIYHILYKLNVEDTYAWGKEVYSPFEGYIRKVENNKDDRITLNIVSDLFKGLILAPRNANKSIDYFLGNHLIIESIEGTYALMAHLRKGSIKVEEGQLVKAGDIIGQIGNSGNTIQPHLHFQLMNENDPSKSIPIPFSLKSYKIKQEGYWKDMTNDLPKNYQTFVVE